MLPELERKLTELWEKRQRLLDAQEQERQRQARYTALADQARDELLPPLRDWEVDWDERFDAWLAEGLSLYDERSDKNVAIRRAYGRPRTYATNRLLASVKAEVQRRRALSGAGSRDHASYRKQRARDLRDLAKSMEKARKTMAGGGGSVDQARKRAEDARAAADALEGKTPQRQEPDGMFITPQQARSV